MTSRELIHVGTSGYQYDHWRGVLYGQSLPKSRWLEHYAGEFETVEINNTFYNLPGPSTFDAWRQAVPPGFRFALKMSRFATHMKKLKDPDEPIARFLGGAERLRGLLGPILVQLPPNWYRNRSRLSAFLDAAPRRYRWAVELRDESWLHDEIFQVLADHGAALVVHDMIEDHPRERTASFAYLRFHGDHYRGRYSPQKLGAEARWLRQRRDEGVEAYVYFNNDGAGCAVRDARALRRYLQEG